MRETGLRTDLGHLERIIEARVNTLRSEIDGRILILEQPVLVSQNFTAPPNYLPNSLPEWSKLAYETVGTTPATVGDTNRECYNWYRQVSAQTSLNVSVGSVTLTGGASGSVDGITVNAIQVMNGVVAFNTSLAATATDVAASINTMVSAPEYTAVAVGTTVYIFGAVGVAPAGAVVSTTTTITKTDVAMAALAGNALKREYAGAEHSLWAANEAVNADIPRWDGVNGLFLLGGSGVNWDIACPLPTDFVFPGQRFYVYLEAATDATLPDMDLYCGFWDNTNADWIKGTAFTPTGTTYGVLGARNLKYKIHARTDTGDEMLSTEIDVLDAPATLTTENHVRLSFSGAPGFIYYGIYRRDGTNYYRVGEIRNSIDLQFFDMVESGSTVVPVAGYPSISGTAPRAYAVTDNFDPDSNYAAITFTIQVPTTYDRGSTDPSMQWFRFGVNALVTGGDERAIKIRRISVSEGYGNWTRSLRDMTAASGPTATATGAPPAGGTTGDPPAGGGGHYCVLLDTKVRTVNGERMIEDVYAGDSVDLYLYHSPVQGVKTGEVAEIVRLRTSNGLELGCSKSHRLIRSAGDEKGIAASRLEEGHSVLTCIEGRYEQAFIVEKLVIKGHFTVKSLRLKKPHRFITNGFVSHNAKPVLLEV